MYLDYKCVKCGKIFEEWVKNADIKTMPCICGGIGKKKFPLPGLRLEDWKMRDHIISTGPGGKNQGEHSKRQI